MGLFDDYCGSSENTRLNIVEYNQHRYYLLPDHLEWYYEDIKKPKKSTVSPRHTKEMNYDFGTTEFDHLLVCVTNRCNIVCDYCFRGFNFSKTDELNFEQFKEIADYFESKSKNNKTFQFTGGEVFVKEDIEQWFEYLHGKNFRIWMTTNAVHKKIHESKIIRKVFENNPKVHVRVSLDGPTAEMHERYRQKGTFSKVIENLKYLVSIGTPVSAKTVITHENIHHVEGILELCHELGLSSWNYNVIRYTGALAETPPEDSTPKIDGTIEYFGYYQLGIYLTEVLERKPYLTYLIKPSRMGKILNTLYSSSPIAVPMSYYVIKFDGNVYYNDNLYREEYCAGNYHSVGINAFKGLKDFRKKYDYDLPACSSCSIHRFCFQKGDYGELYDKDPSLQSEFPNCDDLRAHFFYLMDLKHRGLSLYEAMYKAPEYKTQ